MSNGICVTSFNVFNLDIAPFSITVLMQDPWNLGTFSTTAKMLNYYKD